MPRGRLQKSYKRLTSKKEIKGELSPGDFSAPSHLPELGRELWGKLIEELTRLKIVSILDKTAMEALCQAYCMARLSFEEMQKGGLIVQEASGIKKHPSHSIFKSNSEILLKYLEAFGLTPRGRALLGLQDRIETETDHEYEFFRKITGGKK